MNQLIDANLHFLQQAAKLVVRLEDNCYARCEPGPYNSSIGAHLRHCLEHYEAFTDGLVFGKIDYDARRRDEAVETETGAAHERIAVLLDQLGSLKGGGDAFRKLVIKMDCGEERIEDDCGLWQESTVGRELQFLVSHTVHHFAMIRNLCVGSNTEICSKFGVAPSTIKHHERIDENTA